MDSLRSTPHHTPSPRRIQGVFPAPTVAHQVRDPYKKKAGTSTIGQCPPPVQGLLRCVRAVTGREAPPITTLGPCHRTQTRSPTNPHQQNHTPIPDRATGVTEVHKGAHNLRDHSPLEKPICHLLLLYKEEEWEVEASPRLLPCERLDHQKLLSAPAHPPAD